MKTTSRELLLDKNTVLAELAKREAWQVDLLKLYRSINTQKLANKNQPRADGFGPYRRLRLVSNSRSGIKND